MAGPLLETKFHLPAAHGRLVPRGRLSELIAGAARARVTLVSAPAGVGKATVMSELAGALGEARLAWLSLEPSDNDPLTFWTYVIEAIDRSAPGAGSAARSVIAGGAASIDAAVTTLLNDLAKLPTDLVLVLDD